MATKKFDRTVWHGTDCDKVTSLFEYGLLVRYITKEKSWQCIYRNPYEPNKFSYSWISEEDMREMFLTGWAKDDLKSFCSYVGDTWNDWLLRPVATRIYDLVSYYGAEEIFGNSYRTYTAKEVCLSLRIKYMEEYEYWADDESALREELHNNQYEDRLYYKNGDVYVGQLNEIA